MRSGSLFAPTVFGLTVFALKFACGPAAGRWMDGAERMHVIKTGILWQTIGVLGALCVFGLLLAFAPPSKHSEGLPWPLLIAMITCGVAEALGALISSVAVKKDWVPAIWSPTDPTLTAVNENMATIDLVAEILGPLAAGTALQFTDSSTGFVIIGLVNILSFGLEMLLLRSVYLSNAQLSQPKPVREDGSGGPQKSQLAELQAAWSVFFSHPSGIPLLVISYSLLYFTVLSPHGVVLTAYLQTRDVSPPALAAFRAAGAASGVLGIRVFRMLADSQLGLRRLASLHLWLLAIAVLIAAYSFYGTHKKAASTSSSPSDDSNTDLLQQHGLTPHMISFLGMVVLSRFGLYGFDLAVLQLQQVHVDETHRNSVGSIESSLCSLGTASIFVATLLTSTSDVHSFDGLVYGSACFVSSAAVVYTLWCCFYHEHVHTHPLFLPADGVKEGDGAMPGAVHKHTSQQRRSLEESDNRTHVHLHFHPPFKHSLDHLLGHAHSHAH